MNVLSYSNPWLALNDFFQFEKLSISIEPFNHFWHHLAKKHSPPFFSNLALNQCVYTHYLNEVLQKRKWSLLTTVRRGRKKRKPQIHENYAKVDLQKLIKEFSKCKRTSLLIWQKVHYIHSSFQHFCQRKGFWRRFLTASKVASLSNQRKLRLQLDWI